MTIHSPPSMRLEIKAKWLMFCCFVLKFRMILVGLEMSHPGCPIQSLEPPKDETCFRSGMMVHSPPKAWNQGEVVEARRLIRTRRGVLVFATTAG